MPGEYAIVREEREGSLFLLSHVFSVCPRAGSSSSALQSGDKQEVMRGSVDSLREKELSAPQKMKINIKEKNKPLVVYEGKKESRKKRPFFRATALRLHPKWPLLHEVQNGASESVEGIQKVGGATKKKHDTKTWGNVGMTCCW